MNRLRFEVICNAFPFRLFVYSACFPTSYPKGRSRSITSIRKKAKREEHMKKKVNQKMLESQTLATRYLCVRQYRTKKLMTFVIQRNEGGNQCSWIS